MFRTSILALAFSALASAATVVTFNPAEIGGIGSITPVTTQWSAHGITGSNLYFYEDSRDTFDTYGVSINFAAGLGSIFFAAPTTLSIDYFVIEGFRGIYNVYDSANNLLDTLTVNAAVPVQDVLGSYTFNGANITRLDLVGVAGFVQVSTLRFNDGPVIPEPSTVAMLVIGVGGFALLRRRA